MEALLSSATFKTALVGAFGGFWAATRQDRETFKGYLNDPQTLEQFRTYNWKLAGMRAFKGAVTGFIAVYLPVGIVGSVS